MIHKCNEGACPPDEVGCYVVIFCSEQSLLLIHTTALCCCHFKAHSTWQPLTLCIYNVHKLQYVYYLLFHCIDTKKNSAFFPHSISVIKRSAPCYHKFVPRLVRSTLAKGEALPLIRSIWPFTFGTCTPLDVSIYFLITFTLPAHFATFAVAVQSRYTSSHH